jgi:hypothetical protein
VAGLRPGEEVVRDHGEDLLGIRRMERIRQRVRRAPGDARERVLVVGEYGTAWPPHEYGLLLPVLPSPRVSIPKTAATPRPFA